MNFADVPLHERANEQIEIQRLRREVVVPTQQEEVKRRLRQIGEPITLFAEGPYDRSERLRTLLARMKYKGEALPEPEQTPGAQAAAQEKPKEVFYTPGTEKLKAFRNEIVAFSIPRAQARVAAERQDYHALNSKSREEREAEWESRVAAAKTFVSTATQVGGKRVLSCCSIDPSSKFLLTASWDGDAKIWSIPDCKELRTMRGHSDRLSGCAWHPSGLSEDGAAISCATGGLDKTVRLWGKDVQEVPIVAADLAVGDPAGMDVDGEEDQPPAGAGETATGSNRGVEVLGLEVATLRGHTERISKVAFHPSGRCVASTSFDMTWRLWDVESQECLLEQEGHAREVYGVDFHPDGSLIGTTDLSGICRVWDLRTGRAIQVLQGHFKQTMSLSFSPNGHHIATGSEDNTCRIWDLRKASTSEGPSLYTIAAHNKMLSTVKYEPQRGSWLMTAAFDTTLRLWDARTFEPLKPLPGHDTRVMRADISSDGRWIVSAAWDRKFKLWRCVDRKRSAATA